MTKKLNLQRTSAANYITGQVINVDGGMVM